MIADSELILNEDGSIYHLNLLPEHISNTIITVGDPDRVDGVTKYFDTIEVTVKRREFHTQTGKLNGKRLTVISTGIGTDNIDIVLNELDALVNIDFANREEKSQTTALNIVRIGTSGAIQNTIPVNSFIVSKTAIGFDSLLHYYDSDSILNNAFADQLHQHLNDSSKKSTPYVCDCSNTLLAKINSNTLQQGVTATNVGFYAPQGRQLRGKLRDTSMMSKLQSFRYNGNYITNLEMETSGIYGMAKLLGHHAVSLNAILANRATGEFSKTPQQTTDQLIQYTLQKLTS